MKGGIRLLALLSLLLYGSGSLTALHVATSHAPADAHCHGKAGHHDHAPGYENGHDHDHDGAPPAEAPCDDDCPVCHLLTGLGGLPVVDSGVCPATPVRVASAPTHTVLATHVPGRSRPRAPPVSA